MFDLSKIKPTRKLMPPRIVIYGSPGLGKTTFASQCPNPIFIPCEEGFGALEVSKFPKAETYDQVITYLDSLLQQEHKYKTLVIDTLDRMEKLLWDQVCKDKGKKSIEEIGYSKGYIFALQYFEEIQKRVEKLWSNGMAIVFTCHSLIKPFTPPTELSDGYDRYILDLNKHLMGAVVDWVDFVLFLNYQVYTIKTEKKQEKGVGEGKRFIFTQERPGHLAKSRFDLPYEIEVSDKNMFEEFNKAYKKALQKTSIKNIVKKEEEKTDGNN